MLKNPSNKLHTERNLMTPSRQEAKRGPGPRQASGDGGRAAGVPLPPMSSDLPPRARTSTQETRRAAAALSSGFAPCSREGPDPPLPGAPRPQKGQERRHQQTPGQVHQPPPGNTQELSKESSHKLSSTFTQRRVNSRQRGSGQIMEVNVGK